MERCGSLLLDGRGGGVVSVACCNNFVAEPLFEVAWNHLDEGVVASSARCSTKLLPKDADESVDDMAWEGFFDRS
jgi:hypothetical protein